MVPAMLRGAKTTPSLLRCLGHLGNAPAARTRRTCFTPARACPRRGKVGEHVRLAGAEIVTRRRQLAPGLAQQTDRRLGEA